MAGSCASHSSSESGQSQDKSTISNPAPDVSSARLRAEAGSPQPLNLRKSSDEDDFKSKPKTNNKGNSTCMEVINAPLASSSSTTPAPRHSRHSSLSVTKSHQSDKPFSGYKTWPQSNPPDTPPLNKSLGQTQGVRKEAHMPHASALDEGHLSSPDATSDPDNLDSARGSAFEAACRHATGSQGSLGRAACLAGISENARRLNDPLHLERQEMRRLHLDLFWPLEVESEPLQEEVRQMAVSLLCGMVHSTPSTRLALWNSNGIPTLLQLLKEEDWQGPALDALAAWLVEDFHRIEMKLTERGSVDKFVALFTSYQTRGGSDSLARLLDPFLRILKRSSQLTMELAVAGLAGVVVEMLRTASALTALSLLQMVRVIYEHHPRPKEFVAKYDIVARLNELTQSDGEQASVIVKKRADNLLQAFQINSVF